MFHVYIFDWLFGAHNVVLLQAGRQAGQAFPRGCQSSTVASPDWLLSLLSEAQPCLHLATSVSVSSHAARRRSMKPHVTIILTSRHGLPQPTTPSPPLPAFHLLKLGFICITAHFGMSKNPFWSYFYSWQDHGCLLTTYRAWQHNFIIIAISIHKKWQWHHTAAAHIGPLNACHPAYL